MATFPALAKQCNIQKIVFMTNCVDVCKLLKNNEKLSSGKKTRAINIRYFFLTDQIKQGNMKVEYCPTKDMIGDYMTKLLQGELFYKFKKAIIGN